MSDIRLPLVSIVIPVYNGANFLRAAVDSALNQTYENVEVLVVNDGSTDNGETEAIALSYRDKIRYFRKENGGVSSALNFGIRQMKGEYFAWLSHDDVHLPQKVEKQMDAVLRYKGNKPAICVCNYFLIDEAGKEILRAPQNLEQYFRRSLKCFLGAETSLMIDGDATLISKQVFDRCGVFSEALFASQETDMWYRASETAEFLFIPDYLVGYRTHGQQVRHKRERDVGLEAGAYRGNLIRQASPQEIREYIGDEADAFRFGSSIYHYMRLYFYDASHALAEKLRLLCTSGWKHLDHVLAGMFDSMDTGAIKKLLIRDVQSKSAKPKILLFCKHWAPDGLSARLTLLMEKLHKTYDFILVYFGRGGETFPPYVQPICLRAHASGYSYHHAICVALLAELFDVDLLWCNAAVFLPDAAALSYLQRSRIRTIASVHYSEPADGYGESLHNMDDQRAHVADASILTFENHELLFAQYFYPYDAVLMPALSARQDSLALWSLLLETALSPEYERERLPARFRRAGSRTNELQPADVIEKIKPMLEKYAEYALAAQLAYYEQSVYWKMTKPLRWLADRGKRLARRGR